MSFPPEVIAAAAREREVKLTTKGRRTGKPHMVTIWVSTDGDRLFIRSGGGLGRDWPQNLMAAGTGVLHVGGKEVAVRARQVTDAAEARAVSGFVRRKYGSYVKPSAAGEPLTPGETASFELLPV